MIVALSVGKVGTLVDERAHPIRKLWVGQKRIASFDFGSNRRCAGNLAAFWKDFDERAQFIIVNVILNGEKKIIASFAGDLEAAYAKGCDFLTSLASVPKVPCDITVVTNGEYPLDRNIYQAVKGLTPAEATNKVSGVTIMLAGLADGPGGKGFYNNLAQSRTPKEYRDRVSQVDRRHTVADQWESQVLARILSQHHVIMAFDLIQPELVTNMHMEHAKTLDQALRRAYEIQGSAAKVTVRMGWR